LQRKKKEIIVKQFKDGSSNFWVDGSHYSLNEDNSISFCAGGIDTEEKRIELESFIKRNKKQYKSRDYKAW